MQGQRWEGTRVPGTNRTYSRSTYNRKQRNFTCSVVLMHQQNQTERDTQMEKSHVKTGPFILCLVDAEGAQSLISYSTQIKNIIFKPSMVVPAGRSLGVQGQADLQSQFPASQGFTVRPCFKTNKTPKTK